MGRLTLRTTTLAVLVAVTALAGCGGSGESAEVSDEFDAELSVPFDVDTTVIRYDGMLHGFLNMREIVPESQQAVVAIAEFLRKHVG